MEHGGREWRRRLNLEEEDDGWKGSGEPIMDLMKRREEPSRKMRS
jgi:hypothetical protein